jgi:hypothetical protein
LTIWTSFSVFLQSFVNKPFLTPILPYFQALFRPPFFSLSLKVISLKTKGFNFNREEAHSRDGKWEKVANKMRGTMSKETVKSLKKCSR